MNLENMSTEDQFSFIEENFSIEEINQFIVSNYSDKSHSLIIKLIVNKGRHLLKETLDFLIELKNSDLIHAISENHWIMINVFQMRDMLHVVSEDVLKKHPCFKDFWIEAYVKEEKDFLLHTKNHIRNVSLIANNIIVYILDNDELIEYFQLPRNKTNKEIVDFINRGVVLHDKAKICEDDLFLKENGLIEPLYKTLYSFYGKGMNPELKKVVNKLNKIDNQIIEDYLVKYDTNLKNLFFKIEKMADCIERGCNKITSEEMRQNKIKPSIYLQNELSPTELNIIKHFEEIYDEICFNTL